MSNALIYEGPIVAKPRMVRSDRYRKRSVVERYWAFKDLINLAAKNQNFTLGECFYAIFEIEMPKSWSKKKKDTLDGKPHQQKPDGDNLIKSVQDSMLQEDSHIWKFSAEKRWAKKNRIIIQNIDYA